LRWKLKSDVAACLSEFLFTIVSRMFQFRRIWRQDTQWHYNSNLSEEEYDEISDSDIFYSD
jgi:hypothetical protein